MARSRAVMAKKELTDQGTPVGKARTCVEGRISQQLR